MGVVDAELRRELLARRDDDQRVRTMVPMPRGQHMEALSDEHAAEWERVDQDNTWRLSEIVAARGWPGRTLVGDDGALAAWLIAQHADREPAVQLTFLQALRGAVAAGEALPAHLACLEDRVRVNAGRPQLYGTQFTVTDGIFGPRPIEDPQHLDERRTAVGLEPFAAYEAQLRGGAMRD
jgi:hypothetical protein